MLYLLDTCLSGAASRTLMPRLKSHMLSSLACLGRHTITGVICTAGRQFFDWTALYRVFSRGRFDKDALFAGIRRETLRLLPLGQPAVIALDDTRVRKCGKRTAGVSVMRDPLGPRYRVNLMLAQRFVQISMAYQQGGGAARMLPVDFAHAPLPAKPGRKAPPEQHAAYRQAKRDLCLGRAAANRLALVRSSLDAQGEAGRPLICTVDGGYTNRTFLKYAPERCEIIGRIRGDAKLHFPPEEQPARGRRRVYGKRAPTPEQLRQDASVPWQKVTVNFSGAVHEVRVKTLACLRWAPCGAKDLRLVAIAPIKYHVTPQGRSLYRQPGYLICTDPSLPLEQIVQKYIWRWDIENNFRDEKTVLGVGEAQVRTANSVELVPAAGVAAYSMLLLASLKLYGLQGHPGQLPPPKWQRRARPRASTQELVSQLRYELWRDDLISPGSSHDSVNMKPEKCTLTLAPALFYGAACA